MNYDIKTLYEHFLASAGICTDTRSLQAGQMFFALKGTRFNANRMAGDALKAGAACCVVDEPVGEVSEKCIRVEDVLTSLQALATYHRQQLTMPIIGITGSNGKTTVKELLAAAIAEEKSVFATPGNLNNHIGLPLSILQIRPETDIAILELGDNHPGEIAMLSQIAQPTHGFVTNVGKDHLEGFGSMEANYRAKAELFDYLAESGGTVFLDATDPQLDALAASVAKAIRFADLPTIGWPEQQQLNIAYTDEQGQPQPTQLYGRYNLANLRAAYSIARHFGITPKAVNHALTHYTPRNNRSQLIHTERNTILLDAYNANPTSVALAIQSLAQAQDERPKWVILGDMLELGGISEEEHRSVLEMLEALELRALCCGPCFADVGKNTPLINCLPNFEALAEHLRSHPLEASLILIKGSRGMRMERVVELI